MRILRKIQKLPESQRKIILWILTFLIALFLGWLFFKDVKKRLSEIRFDEIFQIKLKHEETK